MEKRVMVRHAADNPYFHRDFHGTLNLGITYIRKKYGNEAVREYLVQFTDSYFAPLKKDVLERGLTALREHFEKIYTVEGGNPEITFSPDELTIRLASCPAVTHLHEMNIPVDPLFYETTSVVNSELCKGSPFAAELLHYNPETGASTQRFYRITPLGKEMPV